MATRNAWTGRLGTALLTWAVLILAATAYCVTAWLRLPPEPALSGLRGAAMWLVAGGLAYLPWTALLAAGSGWRLKQGRGDAVVLGPLAGAGHAVVLLAVAYALWVGPTSRALLVGLDPLIATLGTVSLLSLLLEAVGWWIRRGEAVEGGFASRKWAIGHVVVSLGVVLGAAYLESQSLEGAGLGAVADRWGFAAFKPRHAP